MEIDTRFPSKLDAVRDAPERLRGALLEKLSSEDSVQLLLYAAALQMADETSPATVLAITNTGWLLASETEYGHVTVNKSDFSDTLLLELTSILLFGQLKIHFATMGDVHSATTTFETVGEELYREAIVLMLNGIDQTPSPAADDDRDEASRFEAWPVKFGEKAQRYRPKGQRLLAAIHWPAISGGFQRELCPAAALLVTSRELVLISEVKTLPRHTGDLHKFSVLQTNAEPLVSDEVFPQPNLGGAIITYFPRARLAGFHVSHHERFGVLAVQVHAAHGEEKLEIIFPSDHEKAVSDAIKQK